MRQSEHKLDGEYRMAGPQLTEFLATSDYDTYRTLVRHFNHDAANRISRITTECSIIARIVEKIPPGDTFTNPTFQSEAGPLAEEAKALIATVSNAREFFWPPGDDVDTINRGRWQPFDATVWDNMMVEFALYLQERLEPVLPLFERLKRLEEAGAIRTDGKAAPLAKARHSISGSIGDLEELLKPETWDALLDEWLERATQNG
jgi:hypothetical protein